MPLHFEANEGQFNPEVRYVARSAGQALFLTQHGPVLAAGSRRVDISLALANAAPAIEPLDRLPGKTSYFTGRKENWRAGVPQYGRVAYRSVYPGIDIVYYGSQDQLEYDFVLQPGADPRAIQWQFRGADHLHLSPEGDLVIQSGGAEFVQKRPVLYQQGRRVEGHYTLLAGGKAGVEVGPYDRSKTLVIDPVLSYGSFLGGGDADQINALAIDSNGRMYVTGSTLSADLPANTLQLAAGSTDCFIAILDSRFSGAVSLPVLAYLGGGRQDSCTAITLDRAGHIYVAGTTTSGDFPLAGSSVQTSLNLSTTNTVFQPDAFVSELDPANGLLYSTYFGGTGAETPHGIGIDSQGFIYVLGTTESSDMPVTNSAYQNALWGPSDMFLLKLDPNATSPAYVTYLGGEAREDARGFALSSSGLVYFAASTFSSQFPLAGPAFTPALKGLENIVLGVIDTNRSGVDSLRYATYFGGSISDEVRKIALDSQGRLLVTGWTLSPDFPTTANAMQPKLAGSADAFVARVNPLAAPDKFLDYSTYLGGSDGEVAYDIASDPAGMIYVAGYTLSADFPVTSDAVQGRFGNGIDAFVAKLNPAVAGSSALKYGSFFGQAGVHVVTGLAVGPDGAVYAAGYTTPDLQTTDNAAQGAFAGGYSDGFAITIR